MVTEITKGADGRASGVRIVRDNGERQEIRAAVVVVAASAIESARLLLSSKLGRSSGLVGKGLMFLTVANGEATFLRHAGDPAFASGPPFFDVTTRLRAGVVNYGFAHPNPIFNAEKLAGSGGSAVWGKPLVERLRRHFREGLHVDFEGYSPCSRDDANAVDLDPEVRDKWGVPVARITFKRPERDFAASLALATEGTALLTKAGADRAAAPSHGESLVVVQSGTCRMGEDARTSVVDASGKLHDAANVFVADSAVFPTSGSVPHTLTIVANALRIGEAIARR
jgi:choline dehydrogenase-like flavoprotein